MDFPPIEEALASLAAVDPADLSRVASLRAMHAECAAAGVFAGDLGTSAASAAAARAAVGDECAPDVAKLHQIFDAAVRRGVSQLVCHYVDEVCGHDDFSSPDGVEAYLQDGECVAEWAYAALRAAEGEIERAPHHDRPADALDRAAAVLEALREILRALGADPEAASEPEASSASSAAPADSRLQRAHDDAARGAQLAAALSWAHAAGLGGAAVGDRHGGPAAWAGSVAARRAAALAASNAVALPPAADAGGLFLDDLLSGVGATRCPYPFRSVVEAASRVFGGGSAAPAALVAKQSLFLYYLLDKDGATSDLPGTLSAASYARSARTPARLFSETRAAALLDDAFENRSISGGETRALDEAAALVPSFADSRAPAKFVAALCARGRPEAALAAQRSRERGGPAGASAHIELVDPSDPAAAAAAEAEAETERELGVALRLECGLATEAFLAARDATREGALGHVASARAPTPASAKRRVAFAGRLAARLAAHARRRGALESLLELPFEGELERAFVAWLRDGAARSGGDDYSDGDETAETAAAESARCLVSYYLARGRGAEAAAHAAALGGGPGGGHRGVENLPPDVRAALEHAARTLPEAAARLVAAGAEEAASDAAGGARALARGLATDRSARARAEFAATPRGFATPGEAAAGEAGVLRPLDGATADGAATGGAFPLVHPPGFCAAADETLRDAGRRRRGDVAKRGAGLPPVAAAAPAGDAEPPSWTSLRFDESSARATPGAGAADAADAGAEDAMDATDAEDAMDAMDATDATFATRRNVPSTTTTSPRARPPTKCFVSRFAASPFGGARRRRDDADAEIPGGGDATAAPGSGGSRARARPAQTPASAAAAAAAAARCEVCCEGGSYLVRVRVTVS